MVPLEREKLKIEESALNTLESQHTVYNGPSIIWKISFQIAKNERLPLWTTTFHTAAQTCWSHILRKHS